MFEADLLRLCPKLVEGRGGADIREVPLWANEGSRALGLMAMGIESLIDERRPLAAICPSEYRFFFRLAFGAAFSSVLCLVKLGGGVAEDLARPLAWIGSEWSGRRNDAEAASSCLVWLDSLLVQRLLSLPRSLLGLLVAHLPFLLVFLLPFLLCSLLGFLLEALLASLLALRDLGELGRGGAFNSLKSAPRTAAIKACTSPASRSEPPVVGMDSTLTPTWISVFEIGRALFQLVGLDGALRLALLVDLDRALGSG